MKITSKPILLVEDIMTVMRTIDAYWTLSEVPQ
jgi:hypothetical protein